MARHESKGISRRTFLLGGAVVAGSLLLPKIPGTAGSFLVPFAPDAAWADELGAAANIMVVGRKQIGIAVGDMGTLDASKQTIRALSGATVSIYSYYNQKTVTGTTDASGRAVFDISELAEPDSVDSDESTDSNGKKLEYCFNGCITVVCEGYREVVIPLMRVRSVSAIIVPTRVFKEGEPYLRKLAFDRWDLQYTDATFVSSSDNDEDHTFETDLWVPANEVVRLTLYYTLEGEDGQVARKEIASTTFKGGQQGSYQSARYEGRYLCPDWPNEALPVGCKVCAMLETDDGATTITSGMEVKEAPFVDDEDGEIDVIPEAHMDGGDTPSTTLAKLPSSGLPKPFAGSTFNIWKPSFEHVMYDFSPLGYMMFGVKLGSLKLTKDAGPFETAGWKRQTKESVGQQFTKLCKKQMKDIADVGDMYKPDEETGKKKLFAHECSKEVSIKGCFQVYAQMTYDWGNGAWTGDLNAVIGGGVEASWTIQMVIVVVPVYITFELGAQVTAGLKFAMRSHGKSLAKVMENAIYDSSSSGAGVTITISVGLTLGVGVADVLCAYIRGEGYITLSIFYQESSENGQARVRLGVGLEASLGVQILLFSWSGKLWSGDWPGLYDSHDDAQDAVAAMAAGGMPLDSNGIPRLSAANLAESMRIVTNKELRASAEFEANDQAVALFTNEEPAFIEPVDLGDDNLLWDVPPQGGVDEAGVALFADEEPEEHFIYLGMSNTGATLPSKDNPALGSVDVSDVSSDVFGGVKPSVDKCIFTNVFSDPRTKTIYSSMFRIATVMYGDEARTRVVYTDLSDSSWSNPHVIEFDPVFSEGAEAVSRADMYDYDFAITALNGVFGDYLYLMVISGTRPQGDGTTFAEANAKTVVSIVRLYNSYNEYNPWQCDRAAAWAPSIRGSKIASFSSPCIATYADGLHFDRETNSCVIGACLVRAASKSNPSALLEKGAGYVLTFHIDHRGKNEFKVVTKHGGFDRLLIPGSTKLVMGPVTFDRPLQYGDYDRVDRHVHIGAVGSNGAAVYRIQVTFDNTVSGSAPTISTKLVAGMDDDSIAVQRLYPTGNDLEFYAVRTDKSLFEKSAEDGADVGYRRDGRLYLMRIEGSAATYTPITPTGTCIPSELLVSRDGRYLFYMVNKEGKSSRGFVGGGEVGPEKTAEQEAADNSYRVMALARVGNLFTKPFTLAVLDHPLDYITSMVSWGSTATLIGAEIKDPASSKADIHDIRIPLAVVATPLSAATEGPFAFAGEDTVFDVEVRNDGNTILKGATFCLHDVVVGEDGSETISETPACTAVVDFQPDLVTFAEGEQVVSAPVYDDRVRSGEFASSSPLVSAAEMGLLVPGQSQTYKVTFRVPDDWASTLAAGGSASTERKVRVRIINPQYLGFSADTTTLLSNDAGSDGDGVDINNSNGDFEYLSPEDWAEFFDFLYKLLVVYDEMDLEECPEAEISVLDAGLPIQNFGDLHDGESSSSSGSPGAGKGDGDKGNGDGSGDGGNGSAHSLADTGDHSIIGKLLFGEK